MHWSSRQTASKLALGGLISLIGVLPATAQPQTTIGVYAGVARLRDSGGVTEGGFEVQMPPEWRGIRPAMGLFVGDNGVVFGYLGLRRDFHYGDWRVAPQVALGFYERGDEGPNLGGSLQFRTGFEVSRSLGGGWSAGALLYHLSNSGTKRPNPGTEALAFILTWDGRRQR